jgi:PPIC-type PPIASE domain
MLSTASFSGSPGNPARDGGGSTGKQLTKLSVTALASATVRKALGTVLARLGVGLVSIALGACGTSAGIDATLFCVGDTPVRENAVRHWTEVFAGMTPTAARLLANDDSNRLTARLRAKRFLTTVARTSGEARQLRIGIADAEIGSTVERLRFGQTYGAIGVIRDEAVLVHALRSRAETRFDRLTIVRAVLLAELIAQRLRAITESRLPRSALSAYLIRHKSEFVIPERRDVGVVQAFRKPKADRAREELEAGRSLRAVVEKQNDEPEVGGMKTDMTRDHLRHPYEQNYFRAKPHTIVGPLKSEIYYLFEVVAIKPPRQQSLAEVEPAIRRKLIAGPAHGRLQAAVRALDERWPVRAKCGAGHS